MTMRVAELRGVRQFQLVESAIAGPGPNEIQVRVQAVGVCGSDLHSYSEGAVGDTPCRYPMVLGHEPAGVVVKTGLNVTGWSPGDRAFFEPAIYCYHCEFCQTGHHNVCANLRFLSQPGDPGFFRDFVNLPQQNLMAIPPRMATRDATLIEPLAVVLHSLKFAAVRPSETAVVFGAGPIGLLTIAALKLAGAGRIWAVEKIPYRLELARRMGANTIVDAVSVEPARQILQETGNRGVDVALDCATAHGTINQCIYAVRNAGRMVITGIPAELQTPIDFHPMRRKEISLFNVRRSNHESGAALEILTRHMDRFAPMITHTRALEEIGPAFSQVEQYADSVGKMVIALEPLV